MANYKLISITLTESYLKREEKVIFEQEGGTPFGINVAFQINENILYSVVTVSINESDKNNSSGINIKITMVGAFEIDDNSQFPIEQFANINAPAIIFPFIREHLASLTMKAGINPPILLPPINFVKMAEEQNRKEN